jgi:drug/metabolite transporter (DMT)-like permease
MAALVLFGLTNFILGLIAESSGKDPAASIHAAMILWLGTGLLGIISSASSAAVRSSVAVLARERKWLVPAAAGVTLALGMFLLKSSLAGNPLAKGPIVAVTSSNSMVVALLAWLFLREVLSSGQWAGFLLIVAGIALVSLGGASASHFNAVSLALLAMFCFGLTNFFLKLAGARGCDSVAAAVVLWLSVGACGVSAVAGNLALRSRLLALESGRLSLLALLAGMLLALGMLAIKKAVTLGPAGPAAAVSGSNAILVCLLDYWLLGHRLPALKLTGMLTVIAGIVTLALARPVRTAS